MVSRIALREIPTTSRLFVDYCMGTDGLRAMLPRCYRDPGAFAAMARLLQPRSYDRRSLCRILTDQNERFGTDPGVLRNVQRLEDPAAMVVIGGQQAGLFGGPLYTVHKALTILALAGQAEQLTGQPVVPVFWIASEDSDLAEVNHAWVTDRDGRLSALRMPGANSAKIPVSRIRLGEEIGGLLTGLDGLLPQGDFADQTLADLRAAYTAGRTYPQAFGAWMAALFGSRGLVLVDPSDPRLKRMAHRLFDTEITEASPVTRAAVEQTARLRAAGYEPQIELRDGFLTLFHQDPARDAITITPAGFELKGSGRRFSPRELSSLLEDRPEAFTPNAMMRPLFQDTVFPTLAVVLGPAEIAYFCQLTLAYERLDIPMPLLIPRCSLTLVEKKLERLLEKLDLTLVPLLERGERVVDDVLRRRIPPSLAQRLAEGRRESEQTWNGLTEAIDGLEPTLHRTALVASGRVARQFDFMEKKILKAARRREAELRGQVERLVASLAPRRGLQERSLCALPFLAHHGRRILSVVEQAIDPFLADHAVVVIDS